MKESFLVYGTITAAVLATFSLTMTGWLCISLIGLSATAWLCERERKAIT
jgi:hypothetical protein